MKNLHLFLMLEKKTKGFTLVELVFGLGILSVIFLLISSFIFSSTKLSDKIISSNSLDSEIYYTADYIFSEIDKADYILEKNFINIASSKQLSIFIINKTSSEYSVTSYTFDNKEIIRNNTKRNIIGNINESEFNSSLFYSNVLASNIKDFSANYDSTNKILYLEITDERDEIFKYSHYIRGAIYE